MEFQVIRIRKKCSQMYGKFYLCIHMKTFVMSLLYLLRVYTFIYFFFCIFTKIKTRFLQDRHNRVWRERKEKKKNKTHMVGIECSIISHKFWLLCTYFNKKLLRLIWFLFDFSFVWVTVKVIYFHHESYFWNWTLWMWS